MSIIFIKNLKCSNCGKTSSHEIFSRREKIKNKYSSLWEDIILECGIQRCPSCGYCSPNISKGKLINKAILNSQDYLNHLNKNQYPQPANHYICSSLIQKDNNDYNGAINSLINAETVCENYFNLDAADNSRKKIVELIEFLEQETDFYNLKLHDKERFFFLKIYYLRRLGQFKKAKELIDQNHNKIRSKNYKNVLGFLYDAILNKDKGGDISQCVILHD